MNASHRYRSLHSLSPVRQAVHTDVHRLRLVFVLLPVVQPGKVGRVEQIPQTLELPVPVAVVLGHGDLLHILRQLLFNVHVHIVLPEKNGAAR